jgi:uncharacterized membrane protein YccC
LSIQQPIAIFSWRKLIMESKEPQNEQGKPQSSTGDELVEELSKVGERFVELIRVAWNSEERKRIEGDLRSGLSTVASSLEDGIKQLAATREAQELKAAAEDMGEKVSTSKVVNELAANLRNGLAALGENLEKLAVDIRNRAAENDAAEKPANPPTDTQDIPIDKNAG